MTNKKHPFIILNMLIGAVLVTANVVVFNLWFQTSQSFRWDLTEDRRYEIGEGTRSILEDLEDTVSIKCYFSSNLPKHYSHVERTVIEKLKEYETVREGAVVYQFADPETDESAKQECDDQGIQPTPVTDFESVTSTREANAYMALVFRYQERKSIFNLFVDTRESIDDPVRLAGDLEYYVTNHIMKVANEKKTIGILAQVQEVPLNPRNPRAGKRKTQGVDNLKVWLERSYDVLQLDSMEINRGVPIPEEVDVLLVWRPIGYTDVGLYAVDQFIMRGGPTLFFLDNGAVAFNPTPKNTPLQPGVNMQDFDYPTYMGQPINHGMIPLLEHYGVRPEPEFVQDLSGFKFQYIKDRRVIQMGNRVVAQPVADVAEYPSFPVVPARGDDGAILDGDQLNASTGIAAGVGSFVLAWASPLTMLPDNLDRHGARVHYVVRTGPKSWSLPVKDTKFSANPKDHVLPPAYEARPVAALATGKFNSFFKGQEIPAVPGTDGQPQPVDEDVKKARRDFTTEDVSLFIMGDADFIADGILSSIVQLEMQGSAKRLSPDVLRAKPRASLTLCSNAVDLLTYGVQASALADVRSKKVRSREIIAIEADDERKRNTEYVVFLLIPGIVVVFGLARLILRSLATQSGVMSPGDPS